jgi:CubicO group peptidase (beta-lactamase class C family)
MPVVHGQCDEQFIPLRGLFTSNLDTGRDHGAAVAVTIEGQPVVDLWGGHIDAGRDREWRQDTLVLIMSVTKSLVGICGNMCIERGLLDPNAPVAHYWPEFAAAGKESVLVSHVFDHRAGLPDLPGFDQAQMADWEAVCAALAAQPPSWEPGTAHRYHSFTYGWLTGELLRRVTGKRPNQFLQDEVCTPLNVDAWIGAPPEIQPRLAEVLPAPMLAVDLSAEMPAANGFSNARSLARIFGVLACGGELEGVRLLREQTIADATSSPVTGPWHGGQLTPVYAAIRFGRGFQLNSDVMHMGPNRGAFGHAGGGGVMAWADPDTHVSFAYTPNLFEADLERMYDRANELSRSVFRCLGSQGR